MLERILENWLDKATEKTFQVPFCQMLAAQGHTVIHLTRHCAMELGKDVISIAPDGVPCAYQLKTSPGARITLSQWREHVAPQIDDLVTGRIAHPGLPLDAPPHRAYVVTNRDLDEEVSRSVQDRNASWEQRGLPYKLEVLNRGHLLSCAREMGTAFWPSELTDTRTILELLFCDGRDFFPNDTFAALLSSMLSSKDTPSQIEAQRIEASWSVVTWLATDAFAKQGNHLAVVEGWLMFYLYGEVLRQAAGLNRPPESTALPVALLAIEENLYSLLPEIRGGALDVPTPDALWDQGIQAVSVTWVLGLLACLGLWRRWKGEAWDETDDYLRDFFLKHREEVFMWGEGAVPLIVTVHWYLRFCDGSSWKDFFLLHILEQVLYCQNSPEPGVALSCPYHSESESLPRLYRMEDSLDERFDGQTYTAEALLELFVRRNFKQAAKSLWPDFSRLSTVMFQAQDVLDLLKWHNDRGQNVIRFPPLTQSWTTLRESAGMFDLAKIPSIFQRCPVLYPLFICVYPHRFEKNMAKWFDSVIMKWQRC